MSKWGDSRREWVDNADDLVIFLSSRAVNCKAKPVLAEPFSWDEWNVTMAILHSSIVRIPVDVLKYYLLKNTENHKNKCVKYYIFNLRYFSI